jgi:hypothetical protein
MILLLLHSGMVSYLIGNLTYCWGRETISIYLSASIKQGADCQRSELYLASSLPTAFLSPSFMLDLPGIKGSESSSMPLLSTPAKASLPLL